MNRKNLFIYILSGIMAASCFLTSCDDGESGKSEPACEEPGCDDNENNTKPETKPGEENDCSKDNSCPPDTGTQLCGGKQCTEDEECIEDKCEKVERCGNVLCGDDEECIEDICRKIVQGEACGDTQCKQDEECVDDICKPLGNTLLTCNPDCSADEECIEGKCYPLGQDTCSTIVCNEDELCAEGTCQPIVVDCGGKVCNEDETCINDVCEKMDEKCGDKPKCNDDEFCVEGVCTKVDDDDDDDDDDGDEPPKVDVVGQLVVSPDSGLKTYRSGETDEFSVVLDIQPGQKISVPVKSLDTTLGTVAPDKLTFTTDNWDTPQTVTITGTTAATVKNKTYKVEVGPLNTKDEIYKGTKKITLTVTHVDDKTGKGKCTSKQSKDDAGECIAKPVTGISMNYNAYALRRGETRTLKVNVTPSDASNKDMTWKLVEADTGKTLSSTGSIINWTKDGPSITLTGVAKNAHTVKMTVTSKSNKKISTETTIQVKPYTKLSYQNAFKFKDFRFSCKNDNEDGYVKSCKLNSAYDKKGDLFCETYNAKSVEVFNKDLYTKYVRPRMIRVKQSNGKYKYYGTRASVVAAARFLTLQFPYDIPYYMEKDNKMRITQGDYVWISKEKRSTAEKARIFGLNLSKKAFGWDADGNSIALTRKDKNGNYKVADDLISWSCDVKNKFGKTARNGMACSGFVIWALRNGHMHLGAWTSTTLAYLQRKKSDDLDKLKSYLNYRNNNNVLDKAYEKLIKIKKSDFINISKMTGKEDIKAGDLVWHGDDHSKYGHVAMIIGIKRNNGSISEVYVAEATNTKDQYNANHVEHYKSLKALKESKWTKGEIVSYIIKMDSVYDYYSQKKDGKYLKGEDGVELNGNTYQYSDMWSN